MRSGPSLTRFRKKLLTWFPASKRDLPWRRTTDPYHVWLSEIMLQQTRVAAVIPYYERFVRRFPSVKALAKAPEEEVLRFWSGLGYYSRARNLQKAAQQIVREHAGRFPEEYDDALDLPGIGTYTAPAILSIAYGKRLAVLDGNVARVLARLEAMHGDLRNGGRWQKLQKTADALLAPQAPGDWNQAMMELGATLCTPRSPQCPLCPIGEFCKARRMGIAEEIPEKRTKRSPESVVLAALILVNPSGRTLLLAPPRENLGQSGDLAVLFSRMWHFPTMHVRADAETEARRFASQTLFGGKRFPGHLVPLAKVRHAVTYRQITVLPFRADVQKLPDVPASKTISMTGISSVPISNLTRKIARAALLGGDEKPGDLESGAWLPF